MEHRAWKWVRFPYPRDIPTMLQPEETQYLYWLGASVWMSDGIVLEIGPWLGGSTICLAAGMHASDRPAEGRLHAVDNFLWREFMAARSSLPIQPGESFEPYFLKNLETYHDIVVSHAATLPDEVIEGDHEATAKRFADERQVPQLDTVPGERPIEILFIDGAKSWRGMSHLLHIVRERMMPGKTLLVCQDYKYWGTYWVPMMMSRLRDYIEPVHNVLAATTVAFRLKREIPLSVLDALEDHVSRISTEEGLKLINGARRLLIADLDWLGASNVALCRVSFLAHQGKTDAAVVAFKQAQELWPPFVSSEQLDRARNYLREEKGINIKRPWRFPVEKRVIGAWQRLKRSFS
ncbi:MAG TPA: class I SAM-dependent methyltransferase [Candidatus Krumholzibacteria bacterium]|nr:class I SAM-dependent methyltransferase [Candidatus Krumholzibacteria bacterium]